MNVVVHPEGLLILFYVQCEYECWGFTVRGIVNVAALHPEWVWMLFVVYLEDVWRWLLYTQSECECCCFTPRRSVKFAVQLYGLWRLLLYTQKECEGWCKTPLGSFDYTSEGYPVCCRPCKGLLSFSYQHRRSVKCVCYSCYPRKWSWSFIAITCLKVSVVHMERVWSVVAIYREEMWRLFDYQQRGAVNSVLIYINWVERLVAFGIIGGASVVDGHMEGVRMLLMST